MENVDLTCVQQSRCLVQIKSKAGVSAWAGWRANSLSYLQVYARPSPWRTTAITKIKLMRCTRAVAGIIAELTETEGKTRMFSDAILANIARWEDADRAGKRAVPGYNRIPGAPHPPSAAWNSAVASGVARMLEPKLRTDLGYFYSEFVGIHDNYDRYNQFTEREVLPKEFALDLWRLGTMAHDLRNRLEAVQSS